MEIRVLQDGSTSQQAPGTPVVQLVPGQEVVLGRGPLLRVTDLSVSRSHARVEALPRSETQHQGAHASTSQSHQQDLHSAVVTLLRPAAIRRAAAVAVGDKDGGGDGAGHEQGRQQLEAGASFEVHAGDILYLGRDPTTLQPRTALLFTAPPPAVVLPTVVVPQQNVQHLRRSAGQQQQAQQKEVTEAGKVEVEGWATGRGAAAKQPRLSYEQTTAVGNHHVGTPASPAGDPGGHSKQQAAADSVHMSPLALDPGQQAAKQRERKSSTTGGLGTLSTAVGGAASGDAGGPASGQGVQSGIGSGQALQPGGAAQQYKGRYPPPPGALFCRDPRQEWGHYGRWFEPYDEAAALKTIHVLREHWTRRDIQDMKAMIRKSKEQRATAEAVGGARSNTNNTALGGGDDDHGLLMDRATGAHSNEDAAGGTGGNLGSDEEGSDKGREGEEEQINHECAHAACQGRPFCIIKELEVAIGMYVGRGDANEFKKKALRSAIGRLEALNQPVHSKEDLLAAGFSASSKTTEKVLEVLRTGHLRRNAMQQGDEFHQTVKLFEGVWGIGANTALALYHSGCRTIDDIRQRAGVTCFSAEAEQEHQGFGTGGDSPERRTHETSVELSTRALPQKRGRRAAGGSETPEREAFDGAGPQGAGGRSGGGVGGGGGGAKNILITLSEMARAGLRYYEEFEQKIPREELARIEGVVKEEVVQALARITGLPGEVIDGPTEALHVRSTGSYLRGAASSSDADFIIAAPYLVSEPQAVAALGGHSTLSSPFQLLQELAHALVEKGALLPINIGEHKESKAGPDVSSTLLGVWAPGGPARSAVHRRIDLKVYPRDQLPLALTYFASGTNFNRAIRYWANSARPELVTMARVLNPLAMAFLLSDREFTPAVPLSRASIQGSPAVLRGSGSSSGATALVAGTIGIPKELRGIASPPRQQSRWGNGGAAVVKLDLSPRQKVTQGGMEEGEEERNEEEDKNQQQMPKTSGTAVIPGNPATASSGVPRTSVSAVPSGRALCGTSGSTAGGTPGTLAAVHAVPYYAEDPLGWHAPGTPLPSMDEAVAAAHARAVRVYNYIGMRNGRLDLRCETDIFAALGLAFVPLHMRNLL